MRVNKAKIKLKIWSKTIKWKTSGNTVPKKKKKQK